MVVAVFKAWISPSRTPRAADRADLRCIARRACDEPVRGLLTALAHRIAVAAELMQLPGFCVSLGFCVESLQSEGMDRHRRIRFQEISRCSTWQVPPAAKVTGDVRKLTANFLKSETSSSISASRFEEIRALGLRPFWRLFFSALCFKSENKSKAWW